MPARDLLTTSPTRVDPLSWFSPAVLPVGFGAIAMALAVLALATGDPSAAVAQSIAAVLVAVAFLMLHQRTASGVRELGSAPATIIFCIGALAVVISGLGYARTDQPVERWWAPIAVALLVGASAPFRPLIKVLASGIGVASVVAVAASLTLDDGTWPPLSLALIATSPLIVALVTGSAFARGFVRAVAGGLPGVRAARAVDAGTAERASREFARWRDEVVPLLRAVAESGRVTAEDRARASALGAELRRDLVRRAESSWLDALAADHGILLSDPDGVADRILDEERDAISGALLAIAAVPDADPAIELRRVGGAVTIAVSTRQRLPEGDRIRLLAPYAVALGAQPEAAPRGDPRTLLRLRLPFRDDRRA